MYKLWIMSEIKMVREHIVSLKHPAGPKAIRVLSEKLGRTYGSTRGAIHGEMRLLREVDLCKDG